MPSELVWVAAISSGVGAGSAGLAGLISYFVTKRQTDTQIKDRTLLIEYQTAEAQRHRIAEDRKVYLGPLKLALIQWLHTSHVLVSAINSLTVGYERGVSESEYMRLTTDSINANSAASVAEEELNKHLSQVADPELSALLSEAKASMLPHMPDLLESARASAAAGEQVERGEIPPEMVATMQAQIDQLHDILEQRQEILIRINQRIEILASVAD